MASRNGVLGVTLTLNAGIREEKVMKKRRKAMAEREHKAGETGRKVAAIQRLLPAVVQLTAQFIRTLRNEFATGMRWLAALEPSPRLN